MKNNTPVQNIALFGVRDGSATNPYEIVGNEDC